MADGEFLKDMPVEKDGLVLIGYGSGANTGYYNALYSRKVLTQMEKVRTTKIPGIHIEEKEKGILLITNNDEE